MGGRGAMALGGRAVPQLIESAPVCLPTTPGCENVCMSGNTNNISTNPRPGTISSVSMEYSLPHNRSLFIAARQMCGNGYYRMYGNVGP